ncbi:uncharacterized protein MELLADRAFT_85418 [Melampsora larici-populina 98AG31]|uniref:Transmembrane protein 19 n=1 Tax=Melampsora larici-populina (strain 98AG31 / pathotype 3-4-7) TaxID=747676 RepID=F4RIL7_MELLP|nr:uncharacterized protein MELLADRAFT_85418 [Melampsora larici-populina 98AG31]EGG07586.1 hypothetical protein MELLADRAFT_85418 [Melampsora larici-populina 98AG31]
MAFLNSVDDLYPWSFVTVVLLSIHNFRKASLQLSGALAALLIGYTTLANPNPIFGISLISFFLIGNKATKYKQSIKLTLVDDEHGKTNDETIKRLSVTGGRDWKQVICNAWVGTMCAIGHRFFIDPMIKDFNTFNSIQFHERTGSELSNILIWGALAFWSGCSGDTLGLLSRAPPRLITNLKEVPPGTNGGVSLVGLGFSALGGIFIGMAVSLRCMFDTNLQPLPSGMSMLMMQTGFFGLFCSVVDSFLGATLQQTLYSKIDKKVVLPGTKLGGPKEVVVVSGIDVLSNNQGDMIQRLSK